MTANDKVKISDFGISYMFNESQEDATISNKNASPLFSPPEACSCKYINININLKVKISSIYRVKNNILNIYIYLYILYNIIKQ